MFVSNLICVSFLVFHVSSLSGFNHLQRSVRISRDVSSRRSSLKMGIDVSGLSLAPVPLDVLNTAVGSTGVWTDASNALIIVGGLTYLAYEKRPRGSARDDLIEKRKSTVKGANLGAFSMKFIPKGTIVGRYPGFLRSMTDALASKESDAAKKSAQSYFFAVDDDQVLDPTNKAGVLEDNMVFLGLLKTDTLIARINEPPLGGDVNLYTEIKANGVTVFAERDIFADEELFMDYGRDYDRSSYARIVEEEEEVSAPIVETKVVKPVAVAAAVPVAAPVPVRAAPVKTVSESEGAVSVPSPSTSIFDSLIGNTKKSDIDVSAKPDSRSQGILGGAGEGFSDKKGEILTDAPLYRPALSMKESQKLLDSLDTMSDDEVAAVLSKLQAAVKDRIQNEVSEALLNKSLFNDSVGKELKKEMAEIKKMPRAAPVDPEMRKKYNKELDAIENELEKIYSDPLGVWTEFMKNPERFLEDGEIGNLADDENFQ